VLPSSTNKSSNSISTGRQLVISLISKGIFSASLKEGMTMLMKVFLFSNFPLSFLAKDLEKAKINNYSDSSETGPKRTG
jgi:hypothetical protein